MSQTFPEWHPHDHPEYDGILANACCAELERLRRSTTSERLAFLCDTREVHQRIYQELAPPNHLEYAGTYRGATGTSLAHRNVAARRIGDDGETPFVSAQDVDRALGTLTKFIAANFGKHASLDAVVEFATKVFCMYGFIHPYLDGNGHIQRLIFATIIFEANGYSLLPTWTIHPRPFAEDFALALEDPDNGQRLKRVAAHLRKHVQRI